jgi:hypothetical protein
MKEVGLSRKRDTVGSRSGGAAWETREAKMKDIRGKDGSQEKYKWRRGEAGMEDRRSRNRR